MGRRFVFRQKTEEEKRNIKVDVKRLPEWKEELENIQKEFENFNIQYVKNAISNLDKASIKIGCGGISKPRQIENISSYVEKLSYFDLALSADYGLLSDQSFNLDRVKMSQLIRSRVAEAVENLSVAQQKGVSSGGFWSIFDGKETRYNFERYVEEKDEFESHLSIIPIIDKSNRLLDEVLNLSKKHQPRLSFLRSKIWDAEEKLAAIKRFEEKHGNAFAKAAAVDAKTRSRASSMKRIVDKNKNCPYCGVDIGKSAHLDHIYPVSMGGLSVPENLVWCCASCNSRKSDKGLMVFASESGLEISCIINNLKKLKKHI